MATFMEQAQALADSFKRHGQTYSSQDFDVLQGIAVLLTDADREAGVPGATQRGSYSASAVERARLMMR